MEYFRLGDLTLSRAVLGGHEYLPDGASRAFNEDLSRAVTPGVIFPGFGGPERKAVLACAYDLGINFFDVTIDSEKEALGRNLAEMPPPYEVYVQTRPEGMVYGYDPGNTRLADIRLLRREVHRILNLIRRDHVDVLNFGILKDATERDPDYLARLADAVATIRQEGLIRHAAADTFSGEKTYLAMIETGAFSSLNLNFNFVEPAASESVIPRAVEHGIAVVAREAFLKGLLFDAAHSAGLFDLDAVARAACAWVAAQTGVSGLIIGAGTDARLRTSVAAFLGGESDEAGSALLEPLRSHPVLRRHSQQKLAEFLS